MGKKDKELKSFVDFINESNEEEIDPYYYPDLDDSLHPDVLPVLEEWRKKPIKEREKIPFLYYIFKEGTPPGKMSKEDSQYTDKPEEENQSCGNCEFRYLKESKNKLICSQIRGKIKREGWCKLWVPEKKEDKE